MRCVNVSLLIEIIPEEPSSQDMISEPAQNLKL